jgi:oligopeptide/dipeptide ABC transporter ATP-binding protein
VGESGCGKSQTLRSILGLLKQPGRITGGEIRYKGADIAKMSQRELQKIRGKEISMIFQEPMTALNPVLRIRSQMYEAFEGEKLSKEEKRRRAIELLKLVGIPSPETRLDEYPHQFSGGMRQRAMIAIALGARPKLLLADEPTTALDVTIQDQIMKLLNQLKQELGMSIILVTHDLGVIAQMCDRVAVMYAGQIVEMTDTVTLFSRPRHPYTYGLMGSLPNEETAGTTLEAIKGSPPNLAHLPEGCPFSPRCKYACDLCRRERPALTEVEPGHLARCHRLDVTASFQGLIEVPDGAGRKEDTPHG